MDKKKIKIFLCGYINYSNAQNLNCLALSKNLDPNKFVVYTLTTHFAAKIKSNAILFHCFYPFKLSSFLAYLWGFINCDILYFPKHHTTPIWIINLSKFFKKKVFTTIENNICDTDKESLLNSFGSKKNLINHFKNIPNIYGITKYIIDNAKCGINLKNEVLYLGVDNSNFNSFKRTNLKNIVYVGNLKKRKRIIEFLELAKRFPEIHFNIFGDGVDMNHLRSKAGKNVNFFGQLSHNKLSDKFNSMDLLFLPSKSEGFPKVILEAAASGIPSIVYSDYGAKEWIITRKNGFVLDNYSQVVTTVEELINSKDLLRINSEGAILLAKKFDWKIIINEWERLIHNLK